MLRKPGPWKGAPHVALSSDHRSTAGKVLKGDRQGVLPARGRRGPISILISRPWDLLVVAPRYAWGKSRKLH